MSAVYGATLAADAAGICVLPAAEDGTKQPDLASWTAYQRRRSTREELDRWFAARERAGFCYVMGAVSGGLECFEFDERAAFDEFLRLAEAAGLGELVRRTRDGYEERTPGDGIHWLYYCAVVSGSTALARRPKRAEEMSTPHDKTKTMIETRSEGACMVAAPSHGPVHPTGRPYVQVRGGVATIATIAADERAELYALARSLDRMPKPAPHQPRDRDGSGGTGDRPGDDLGRRASWLDILGPHGWVPVFERNGTTYWRRPGKTEGVSATTDYQGNGLLWVFTASTEFEPDTSYSKFGAYATLEHGGDFGAAARFLASRGYGERRAPSSGPARGGHARFVTRTVRFA